MTRETFQRVWPVALAALIAAAAGLLAGGGVAGAQAAERPQNTAPPAISGTLTEGQTLRASTGSWSGTAPMTFSYMWSRCSDQMSNCAIVANATQPEYRLTSADVGKRLLVVVQAENSAGAATAQASTETIGAPATAPANTAAPAISGTATTGQTLTAAVGSWSGTQPFTYRYQWQRCDAQGSSCANIVGATSATYVLGSADVQRRIRVVVTAQNAAGSRSASSAATAAVVPAAPPGPAGQIKLPNGQTSIPVTSVANPERLIVDRVTFSPNPLRSRQPFTGTFRVVDTRGYVVRDALVFVRSTPLVTTTPGEARTGQDGTVTVQIVPEPSLRLANGHNVQFFVRARKPGDNLLAGVSTRRLVQVGTAAAAR
jgi:hypothetical protein